MYMIFIYYMEPKRNKILRYCYKSMHVHTLCSIVWLFHAEDQEGAAALHFEDTFKQDNNLLPNRVMSIAAVWKKKLGKYEKQTIRVINFQNCNQIATSHKHTVNTKNRMILISWISIIDNNHKHLKSLRVIIVAQ